MSWPIQLTPKQGKAVKDAVREFIADLDGNRGATKAQIVIVLSQMERGIALDVEEQNLLRLILQRVCDAKVGNAKNLETAFFKLYGAWPISPAWWVGTIKHRT